jgi:maltodextrin utilization protein YvdJ
MKQLKVIVQDKTTLVLQEDGQKGDIISLTDLEELDTSAIEKAIQENTDRVYARKLQEYKTTLDATHAKEKTEWESKQQLEVSDLKHKYNSTIEDLKHQIAILNGNMDTKVKEAKNSAALEMEKLAREKDSQYQDLKAKYDTLQANLDEKLKSKELEVTNTFKDKLNQ